MESVLGQQVTQIDKDERDILGTRSSFFLVTKILTGVEIATTQGGKKEAAKKTRDPTKRNDDATSGTTAPTLRGRVKLHAENQ
eukprot:scaffold34597_cov177-Amphora_coffeaeformis.AAC.6